MHKLFGKNGQTECEVYWHVACLSEIVLSNNFDRVAALKLNFDGVLTAEKATSSQKRVSFHRVLESIKIKPSVTAHNILFQGLYEKSKVNAARKVLDEMHYDQGRS